MYKFILGRKVEYFGIDSSDRSEHIIRICRNKKDIEDYNKAHEDALNDGCLGHPNDLIAYLDDESIIDKYFENPEFIKIHQQVFPADSYDNGISWQKDYYWTNEEIKTYIEIRVCNPEIEYDFELK